MAESKVNENNAHDGSYVVKKSRKHNILAFILCVLIAFFVWLYAANTEKKEKNQENEVGQVQTVQTEALASEG